MQLKMYFQEKLFFTLLLIKEKISLVFYKAPTMCPSTEGCGPHRSHMPVLRTILGRIRLCHGKVGTYCGNVGTSRGKVGSSCVAGKLASCSGRRGIV